MVTPKQKQGVLNYLREPSFLHLLELIETNITEEGFTHYIKQVDINVHVISDEDFFMYNAYGYEEIEDTDLKGLYTLAPWVNKYIDRQSELGKEMGILLDGGTTMDTIKITGYEYHQDSSNGDPYLKIITPARNHHGDAIIIYIVEDEEGTYITDDGWFLNECQINNYNPHELDDIFHKMGVTIDSLGEVIVTGSKPHKLVEGVHQLTTALEIGYRRLGGG